MSIRRRVIFRIRTPEDKIKILKDENERLTGINRRLKIEKLAALDEAAVERNERNILKVLHEKDKERMSEESHERQMIATTRTRRELEIVKRELEIAKDKIIELETKIRQSAE